MYNQINTKYGTNKILEHYNNDYLKATGVIKLQSR
jgi:hypothetical protein